MLVIRSSRRARPPSSARAVNPTLTELHRLQGGLPAALTLQDDQDELEAKLICWECVGEAYLKDEIASKGAAGKCAYCGRKRKSYTLLELSARIETAFSEHYERTAADPDSMQWAMMKDDESDYSWEREGEPTVYAIMNAADIPEACASDLQEILAEKHSTYDPSDIDESEFSSDAHYEEKRAADPFWRGEWRVFEQSLITQARFFNQGAARQLAALFENLGDLRTRDGRGMVVDGGPGTNRNALYRARAFQNDKQLEAALKHPDMEIGTPPFDAAASGRMNAHGIAVFYGANEPHVALAEVRPPVGSRVVVARFEITRSIRLLDLTALNAVIIGGSIFDPGFARQLGRASFLRSLGRRIAQPVMPGDEAFSYLVTQAIADFLATDSVVPLDGIIFPSVQAGGESENVVLFHKAARVAPIEFPKGTKLSASLGFGTEEGWETSYTVFEKEPEPRREPERDLKDIFPTLTLYHVSKPEDPDKRLHTLRIDLEAVNVHEVSAVSFKFDTTPVTRQRLKDGDIPF